MVANLRACVKAAPGVIEIYVPESVKLFVVRTPQVVEHCRFPVSRAAAEKQAFGFVERVHEWKTLSVSTLERGSDCRMDDLSSVHVDARSKVWIRRAGAFPTHIGQG